MKNLVSSSLDPPIYTYIGEQDSADRRRKGSKDGRRELISPSLILSTLHTYINIYTCIYHLFKRFSRRSERTRVLKLHNRDAGSYI